MRCNPHKLLIDPYAGSIAGEVSWDPAVFGFRPDHPDVVDRTDSAPFVPRSVVVDHDFDWGDDSPPQTRWADTVIYETHVKSLTRLHAAVPDDLRGTYLGLVSDPVLDHLKGLGVTAVELMPVHHFVDDQALAARGLRNLWGYQPIGWFAPHAGYATAGGTGPVAEFKEMVRRLHAAGLEVVLDVVYNHTAESHQLGPHLSLRGIDNPAYYRLDVHGSAAGTSTTPAPGTPSTSTTRPCRRAIVDSLRHWVTRVPRRRVPPRPGGDAGSAPRAVRPGRPAVPPDQPGPGACRGEADRRAVGRRDRRLPARRLPGRLGRVERPLPGHGAGLWRGVERTVPDLATRLTASADVFLAGGRRPPASSINYVTSHDGFTLADLVAYDRKHNERQR